MNDEHELLLSSEALPESPGTVTFGLFSDTRAIGKKKDLEGKVTFNPDRCHIFFVPSTSSVQPVITPDRTKWDLYLVIIPFTLHQAPGERYYEEMTFFVEMADLTITAFDLFPRAVVATVEETKTYALSPQLKFMEATASLGTMGRQLRFETLHPTITASGEGENTFYWVYKGFKEQREVIPETKHALVVLQVPRGFQSAVATISYEVVIAKKLLGVWKSIDTSTDSYAAHWQLQDAPSFFSDKSQKGHHR